MSQEASVAPKERVNIVYKSAAKGAEEVELPLKILCIGDYTGRADTTVLEDRRAINIDKTNFTAVMAEQDLKVDIAVPDRLSNEPEAELALSLKFESLDDFGPEGILEQVPQLKQLMQLREALTALKGPLGNIQGFRRRIRELLDDTQARDTLMQELGIAPEAS